MGTKRLLVGVGVFGLLAALGATTLRPEPAFAQPRISNLSVATSAAAASAKALFDLPVMVSVIKDGKLIKQSEVTINQNTSFSLPAGTYDVRFEGERMQTLVKRGIHLNEEDVTRIIGGPINAGTGVRIVEYATGALSREEIATRLEKLEAALAALEKARQGRQ